MAVDGHDACRLHRRASSTPVTSATADVANNISPTNTPAA
jgi:hypothetical protein